MKKKITFYHEIDFPFLEDDNDNEEEEEEEEEYESQTLNKISGGIKNGYEQSD